MGDGPAACCLGAPGVYHDRMDDLFWDEIFGARSDAGEALWVEDLTVLEVTPYSDRVAVVIAWVEDLWAVR